MSSEFYCGNCGASLNAGSEYCGVCGTSTSSGDTLAQEITQSLNIFVMRRRTAAIFVRTLVSSIGNSTTFGLIGLALFVIDIILMRNGEDWTAKVLGLRVIRTNGDIAGLAHMWTRLCLSVVSGFILGIGFLWAYVDRNNQTLHDKLSGTYVVLDVPELAERPISSGSKSMIWGRVSLGIAALFSIGTILSLI